MLQANNEDDCQFCTESTDVIVMMRQFLLAKHSEEPDPHPNVTYIDVLLEIEQPQTADEIQALTKFHELNIVDDHSQHMNRMYLQSQYRAKMEMLSEYFKFHRDVPRVIERSIEKILRKHQDKQREHDYKKIKRILKEEQGVSITSLEKTITNEEPSISKNQLTDLGSILKGLQDENQDYGLSDSNILRDVCKQIKGVTAPSRQPLHFRGEFPPEKFFEDFIKREQDKQSQKTKAKGQREKEKDRFRPKVINLKQLLSRVKGNNQTMPKNFRKDLPLPTVTNQIEAKNMLFFSQSQRKDEVTRLRNKHPLLSKINFLSGDVNNRKLLAEIYKSNQNEHYRRRKSIITKSRERLRTKDSSINKAIKDRYDKDSARQRQPSNNKQRHALPNKDKPIAVERDRQTITLRQCEPNANAMRYQPAGIARGREKELIKGIDPGRYSRLNLKKQGIRNMAQSASARKLVISKVNSVAKKPRKSVSTIELNKRPLNGLPKPGNSTSARRKKLLGSRQTAIGRTSSSQLRSNQKVLSKHIDSLQESTKKVISVNDLLGRKLAIF